MDDPVINDPETGLPGYRFLEGDEAVEAIMSMAISNGDPEDDKPSEQQESDELEDDDDVGEDDAEDGEDEDFPELGGDPEVGEPDEAKPADPVAEGEGGRPDPESA